MTIPQTLTPSLSQEEHGFEATLVHYEEKSPIVESLVVEKGYHANPELYPALRDHGLGFCYDLVCNLFAKARAFGTRL